MTAAKDAPCFGYCPGQETQCRGATMRPDGCILGDVIQETMMWLVEHYPLLMTIPTAVGCKLEQDADGVPVIKVGVFPPNGIAFLGDPEDFLEDQLLEHFSPGVLVEARFIVKGEEDAN